MTCIAWDGVTLAADKRAVNSGLARTVTKIMRTKAQGQHVLLAWSGDHDIGAEVRDWFIGGAESSKFPQVARDDKATLLVIPRHEPPRFYVAGPVPMIVQDFKLAIGSGRDYAIAAMELGKDARAAVELACKFDIYCGNGIDTLTLEPA